MKTSRLGLLLLLSLMSCSQERLWRDGSCLPSERDATKESRLPSHTLRDLVLALPFWEIELPYRSSYLLKHHPDSTPVPEDVITLPGAGAQPELIVMRLDRDLVAALVRSEEITPFSQLHLMRRVVDGWQEITRDAFPYPSTWSGHAMGHADKSIVVPSHVGSPALHFDWNGKRYVCRRGT